MPMASGGSEQLQSRDILVQGCYIYGNGVVGSDPEHNVYTEAIGITFQYNHLRLLRPGALGNNLKDRSAGTVICYNWIEGDGHLLDLVDPQDSAPQATQDPNFHQTYVYGNILVDGPTGGATSLVHYGGEDPRRPPAVEPGAGGGAIHRDRANRAGECRDRLGDGDVCGGTVHRLDQPPAHQAGGRDEASVGPDSQRLDRRGRPRQCHGRHPDRPRVNGGTTRAVSPERVRHLRGRWRTRFVPRATNGSPVGSST
jgi:hypothetical protein